jgi:hypothetical protein
MDFREATEINGWHLMMAILHQRNPFTAKQARFFSDVGPETEACRMSRQAGAKRARAEKHAIPTRRAQGDDGWLATPIPASAETLFGLSG